MNGIFGLFRRDGAPIAPADWQRMRESMAHWRPEVSDLWLKDCAGLGLARFSNSPNASQDHTPPLSVANGWAFIAAGRVDNRAELIARLPGAGLAHTLSDAALLRQAYREWGEACVEHLYGDWAFAAWHPVERKLFLARDHFGNTALYYYADERVFAFASDRQALLALNLAPITLDELYLAQVLISWPAYHGERTIHTPIKRLPPAHTLTVTPDWLMVRQYWFLERTPELRLPRREDYVEAFREVFDEAVRAHLRPPDPTDLYQKKPSPLTGESQEGGDNRGADIAVTLSGGLDSGSITATAAGMLQKEGRRLTAFTSVPLSDTRAYVGDWFGDEFPLAQATARHAGNVDLHSIPATMLSPIQAIRRALHIHLEPGHAACNQYWLLELQQTARTQGCRVLLTGQLGNAGISWKGAVYSQPLTFQWRQWGGRRWLKEWLKRTAPPELLAAYRKSRTPRDRFHNAAIHPGFARRLKLLEQRLSDPNEQPPRTPLEERRWLLPGRSFVGALWAEMGAADGLDIRDPSGDARVLAFTFSVPDWVFMDPATGLDRWLIRAAMQGRLPDEVRLNRNRGRQAGDLVPRLRACAAEVEMALAELAQGPAAAYLDVPYMRQVWQMIQTEDTPEAHRKAVTVLTRGIMAGLFVNEFYGGAA